VSGSTTTATGSLTVTFTAGSNNGAAITSYTATCVSSDGGLTKTEASAIVEVIFTAVKSSLAEGRTVRIKNFGTFEVTRRPGRIGVNPMSGEKMFIRPHKGLSFKPARRLKDEVTPMRKPE